MLLLFDIMSAPQRSAAIKAPGALPAFLSSTSDMESNIDAVVAQINDLAENNDVISMSPIVQTCRSIEVRLDNFVTTVSSAFRDSESKGEGKWESLGTYLNSLDKIKSETMLQVKALLDDALAMTRHSLLSHQKTIVEKLYVTRESLAVQRDVFEIARKAEKEDVARIVGKQLEDKYQRDLDYMTTELASLRKENDLLSKVVANTVAQKKALEEELAQEQSKIKSVAGKV